MYTLTQEQLEQLDYFRRMLEVNADRIQKLCSEEGSDISYGFELGKIHADMQDNRFEFMELLSKISTKARLIANSDD